MAKETLLDRAKKVKSKSSMRITQQMIDLSLAWANGEITTMQAATAMGMSSQGSAIYAKLANSLKQYFQNKK